MAEILLTSVAENSASHVRQTEVQLDSFPNATPRRLPPYARAWLQLELRPKQAETNKHNYDFFFQSLFYFLVIRFCNRLATFPSTRGFSIRSVHRMSWRTGGRMKWVALNKLSPIRNVCPALDRSVNICTLRQHTHTRTSTRTHRSPKGTSKGYSKMLCSMPSRLTMPKSPATSQILTNLNTLLAKLSLELRPIRLGAV